MSNQPTKILRGGIGDLLLRVDNITPNTHYKLISHYRQAPELIAPYTTNFEYMFMDKPIAHLDGELDPVTYPTLRFPKLSLKKAIDTLEGTKKIVGIHPLGSELSRLYDKDHVRPLKYMTKGFLTGLISYLKEQGTLPILFCAPNEYPLFKEYDVTVIAEPYIWDTFAFVSRCDLMVGVDSALKTVSAILHKPTVVLLGDFTDPGRDIFINPYKEISTIKFIHIDKVLKRTTDKISELLANGI